MVEMISKIEVIVNKESLKINKSGAITGEIFFSINGRFFPEFAWWDFPIIILTWWFQALLELRNTQIAATSDFLFMDGPYFVRGINIGENKIKMTFAKRQLGGEKVYWSVNCSFGELQKSLLTTAKAVLKTLNQKKWDTSDTWELKRLVATFSKFPAPGT